MGDITEIPGNAAGEDPGSLNQLYEQVYAELWAIARQNMASERCQEIAFCGRPLEQP